eukprot:m.137210 g.137210  ORF g.137210 m.137210 type:complete len:103 (-) comp11424_c0_seq1:470-778(-)
MWLRLIGCGYNIHLLPPIIEGTAAFLFPTTQKHCLLELRKFWFYLLGVAQPQVSCVFLMMEEDCSVRLSTFAVALVCPDLIDRSVQHDTAVRVAAAERCHLN